MNSINDYQFIYDMYISENELFEPFIKGGSHIVLSEEISYNEIKAINEGLQDTVTNYLNKVMNSTQEAWNKFKINVGGTSNREYLRKCADKVRNAKPVFTVNNFPNYNTTTFRNYRVERFSYELMKDDLKTQKGFMQKHYMSLYSERNNINVMMQKNVISGYSNISVDRTMLIRIFNFCSKDFYEVRNSIEQDINVLNESVSNIIHSVNTIISTAQESVNIYQSIINELSTQPAMQNGTNKMSFTDSDGEQSDPGQKAQDGQNAFINCVVNYMKVSTDIISAKMKTLAGMYTVYLNVVKHYTGITKFGEAEPGQNPVKQVEL